MTRCCTHTHTRGTAMIEMVLALPIIFITLSLLFFAGRGVVRVQHALVMDRHDAWLKAAHLVTDTPTDIHVMLRSYRQTNASLLVGPTQVNEQLDEAFLGGRSEIENLDRSYVGGTDMAYDNFLDASGMSSEAMRTYQTMTHITHSVQTSLRTEFDEDSTPLWRDLAGDIRHGHRRDDTTWSFTRGYTQFRVEMGDFILMESADQPTGNTPRLLHVTDTIGNEFYIRTADLVTLEPGYRYDFWQPRPGAMLDPTRGTTAVDLEELYTRLESLSSNSLANAINGVYRGHSPYHYAGPTPYWFGPDIAHRSYGNAWRSY